MNNWSLILLFWTISFQSYSQPNIIKFVNPSFEGVPQLNTVPPGWSDCGEMLFPKETPPNLHPIQGNPFGVQHTSADGNTYLGMVVRENGSWESISQMLVEPLQPTQHYAFRIKLAQSKNMKSTVRKPSNHELVTQSKKIKRRQIINSYGKSSSFSAPIILKIWGGEYPCDRKELLATSPPVDHEMWMSYIFKIQPEFAHQYLIFEAYTAQGSFKNGNILLDDVSPLIEIESDLNKDKLKKIDFDQFDLTISNLKSEEDLQWFALENGLHIQFTDQNKFTSAAKEDLKKITDALKLFPENKIVFWVNERKRSKRNAKIQTIQNQLDLLSIPKSQYEIQVLKKNEKMQDWVLRGDGFFIQITSKDLWSSKS